jgi:hypothetical protein
MAQEPLTLCGKCGKQTSACTCQELTRPARKNAFDPTKTQLFDEATFGRFMREQYPELLHLFFGENPKD